MKNVLIICGAEQTANSEGRFNRSLMETAVRVLSPSFSVDVTHVANGYDIKDEQDKYMQADIVIYQFPVFWFHCPSSMKKYIDGVFERGVFYDRKVPYGTGGFLRGKRYMLSTTWNAPEAAFGDMTTFYQGRSLDEALIAMHQANRYIGMNSLPSYAVHNVVTNPEYVENETRWVKHLQDVLLSDHH